MQLEACQHDDGPLLILAGAGSGKTRVITHRIAYLMDEKAVNPYNILAITFTNKAAKEMRERVDNLIDYGAESVWISTFHSMCVRILRKHIDKIGFTRDFSIYDTDEQKVVIKDVLRTLGLDPKMYNEKSMIAKISDAKEKYMSPDDYEREHAANYREQNIAAVYREYQKRLRSNNALDFDDLIVKTIFLFETNPDVLDEYQERFRYIMVDEYQDTNYTQFVLVKMLAAKYRNLCVVGDEDQSIYKFRGADISNILNFKDQYPEAKVVKLEENYRSTSNILNAANAVVAHNTNRTKKKLWTSQDEGDKVTFTQYQTGYEEGSGIASRITSLGKSGVSLGDIAILYRTNNQSRILEEKLIYEGIPYKLYGGTNFYARKEIRDIVAYLKVVSNSCDDNSVKRIVNVPKRGIGDTTVTKISNFAIENDMNLYDAFLDIDEIPGLARSVEKINKFTELIEGFKKVFEEGDSLTDLFDEICQKTGYITELNAEGTDEAKARIENIEELKNKIVKYEEDNENPDLIGLLEEIALVADVEEDNYEETEKITLMTLHRAKGLEFPYVFITGMEEGIFPSKMSMDSGDPDDLEEERRLCYVGITRAMKKLYLSAAITRMINGTTSYNQKSRFIKEIPSQYLEIEGEFLGGGINSEAISTKRNIGEARGYGSSIYQVPLKPVVKKYDSRNSLGYPGFGKPFPMNGITETLQNAKYQEGDKVKHIKFGTGVIKAVVDAGSDQELTVEFDRVGIKKMYASLAKMKKL